MTETTLDTHGPKDEDGPRPAPRVPLLVLLWSAEGWTRVGEALAPPLDGSPVIFGRGDGEPTDARPRVFLAQQRPGKLPRARAFGSAYVSRDQLELRHDGGALRVENLGRRRLKIDGVVAASGSLDEGQTIEVDDQLLFLCVTRPQPLHGLRVAYPEHAFGAADPFGIVGESAAAWAMREQIALAASQGGHVLITAASGSGKELAANAIHALSPRRAKRLVARSAATFPEGLIDAELFGNAANYPNAGMAERPGLAGEANGSTLFLDEIGELPFELQARLLRVLDGGGDYQRLGDAKRRTTDLRLVAATNRPMAQLKTDLVARMRARLALPGLNERREDIPLLVRHLLRLAAARDPALSERYFDIGADGEVEPRVAPALVEALTRHTYETHVRELDALLFLSIASSSGTRLSLTDDVRRELEATKGAPPAPPQEITADELRACMARHGGVKERVWRELGLANRYVLLRLLRKHGVGDGEAKDG